MASRRNSFAAICSGLVLVFGWTGTPAATEPGLDKDKEALERGKELFTREWVAGDRRSHAGDGLGPVYNAQSCAGCHRQGGLGGAGNNATNVSLVTAFVGANNRVAIQGLFLERPLPPAGERKKVIVGNPGREV